MLNQILNSLRNSDLSFAVTNAQFLNNTAIEILNSNNLTQEQINNLSVLLQICNILYNNTDLEVLPIDDGLYDLLLEKYRSYNPDVQVGAEVIYFNPTNKNENQELKQVVFIHDLSKFNTGMFTKDMYFVDLDAKDFQITNPIKICMPIEKRLHNTQHEHSSLVGTLEKSKFVLISDAKKYGAENDPKVKILERDFFQKHIMKGIIDPNKQYTMVLELKYDGVSVEADCANVIISARSRGDTELGIASDITPILDGYPFPHSPFFDITYGVKFEAIMTFPDLYQFNLAKGKVYKNCRTAIIGLFGSSDAWKYRDFITLIPLAIDQEGTGLNMNRIEEIEFINRCFKSKNQPLRYQVISGNYMELLFQIKTFAEEMEYLRTFIPFMYDGIVVSYLDEDVRTALGRYNYTNMYSMAVKFQPLKRQTIFRKYEFTVGQDGSITPMIFYDPVEFYGTIHPKSSGHSYARFKELNLRIGDIINVEYTNDVMPYVDKAINSHNDNNQNPIVPFITNCPCCGDKIIIGKSGKTAYCTNINCSGRVLARTTNMLQKLNIQNFAESSITKIGYYHLYELIDLTKDALMLKGLGPVESENFVIQMKGLKTNPMYDFVAIGAIGFTGIGLRKWKNILFWFSVQDLYKMWLAETLEQSIIHIKGVGPGTVATIINEMPYLEKDVKCIMELPNIIVTKGLSFGKIIRFTGVRDSELEEILTRAGHDCDSSASVTSTTDILIVPYEGYSSTKTATAIKNETLIVSIDEFKNNLEMYLH